MLLKFKGRRRRGTRHSHGASRCQALGLEGMRCREGGERGHFCVTAARARGTGRSCTPGLMLWGLGTVGTSPFPACHKCFHGSQLSTSAEGANAHSWTSQRSSASRKLRKEGMLLLHPCAQGSIPAHPPHLHYLPEQWACRHSNNLCN